MYYNGTIQRNDCVRKDEIFHERNSAHTAGAPERPPLPPGTDPAGGAGRHSGGGHLGPLRHGAAARYPGETISYLSKLNAEIQGQPGTDPFYGAPTVVVVLADGANYLQDGSLVMGNLMNAAWSLGVASCWINRAKELFERPEGKELLRKWGLPETLNGVGNCILGYADGDIPAPKPRKEGSIVRV